MSILEPTATRSQLPLSPHLRKAPVVRIRPGRVVSIILLVVVAIVMLLPFAWLASSSLKTQNNVFDYPPQWIPDPMQFQNYTDALTYKPFDVYFKNTLIIVTLNVIAAVF